MDVSTPDAASLLQGLPDDARLWIFGLSRPLVPEEEERFLRVVDEFLATWKAHGASLAASRDWRYGRFLLVGVDERIRPPSGCSIDALVGILRGFERELGVEMLAGGSVWYRGEGEDGEPRRTTREGFKEMAATGEVNGDTIVFDLSLTRVGEARGGAWEGPARESWHRRWVD